MSSALLALVFVLMLTGVAGAFLPFVPGTPLILLGALLYALVTDFDPVGPGRLVFLGVLAAFAYLLDHLSGALGASKMGGSRWAVIGALVGGIVGLFFGPLGIVLGPILGAVGFELLYRKDTRIAFRSGMGTVLGIALGLAAKLSIAMAMVALFSYWVLRG